MNNELPHNSSESESPIETETRRRLEVPALELQNLSRYVKSVALELRQLATPDYQEFLFPVDKQTTRHSPLQSLKINIESGELASAEASVMTREGLARLESARDGWHEPGIATPLVSHEVFIRAVRKQLPDLALPENISHRLQANDSYLKTLGQIMSQSGHHTIASSTYQSRDYLLGGYELPDLYTNSVDTRLQVSESGHAIRAILLEVAATSQTSDQPDLSTDKSLQFIASGKHIGDLFLTLKGTDQALHHYADSEVGQEDAGINAVKSLLKSLEKLVSEKAFN